MDEEHELLLKLQTEAGSSENSKSSSWSSYLFPSSYE
jgi:hypothetical protein